MASSLPRACRLEAAERLASASGRAGRSWRVAQRLTEGTVAVSMRFGLVGALRSEERAVLLDKHLDVHIYVPHRDHLLVPYTGSQYAIGRG